MLLDVFDSDAVARDGSLGEDGAVLLDVHDGGVRGTDSRAAAGGLSIGEGNGAEVSESNKGVTRLEVLNNPLGVGLAKVTLDVAAEGVADGLTSGQVLNGGATAALAGGLDSDLDLVTLGDGEAVKVVGVVGVPLIPGLVGSLAILVAEVDTSLENSGLASVTVDTNPSGGTVLLGLSLVLPVAVATTVATGAARASRDTGDSELASDLGVVIADQNGTSPVGAVLLVRGAVQLEDLLVGTGDVGRVAVALGSGAGLLASTALLSERSSQSGSGKEGAGKDSRELHFDVWRIGFFEKMKS